MKSIFSLLLLAVCMSATAQMSDIQSRNISEMGGKPVKFAQGNFTIEGDVFYLPEYKKVSLVFDGAKAVNEIFVKLNLLDNEVIYVDTKNVEMAVATPIKEISFVENGAKFRTGFPSFRDLNNTTFYQVLSDGKAVLLKHYDVTYWENKPFNSPTVTRTYQQKNSYFVFINNKLLFLDKGNVNAFLDATGADKQRLSGFISSKGLKFKNEEDYISLLDFYNKG